MLKGIVSGSPVDIKRIAMKGKNLFSDTMEQGSISGINGQNTTGSGRIRTANYIMLDAGTYTLAASADSNISAYIFVYGIDNTFIERIPTDWENIPVTFSIDVPRKIRFAIRYNNNGNIAPSDVSKIMLNAGSQALPYEPYGMQPGWEVRDQQGTILWAADKTLTGTDSIPIKGYALPLTDYKVEADMTVPATQEYSIEGTSSIDYQSNGTALTDLEFQGNMVQSGTPSSSSPIYPSEMGERTGNLFDKSTVQSGYMINDETGNFQNGQPNDNASDYIPISGDYVSVYAATTGSRRWGAFYDSSKTYISGIAGYNRSIAIPANAAYMRLTVINELLDTLMVNLGSNALPYEPYGYKIPFSNGQTSYNVYLTEPLRKIGDYADRAGMVLGGKRKIKKLVLDGEERFEQSTAGSASRCYLGAAVDRGDGEGGYVCTHYGSADYNTAYPNIGKMSINSAGTLIFNVASGTSASDFKTWLSAQYAAGHPVTIWYVLATEQSEPVTFPTVTPAKGANTLSVSTTLAPSKTRLTATSGVWPKNPIWPAEFGEKTRNLMSTSQWTNSNTDTKSFFQLSITLYSGSTSFGERRLDINENGHFSLTSATAGADGATRLAIKHNGSARDLAIGNVYGSFPANQPLTISFDVTGHDPTTSGGISVSNIMVNEGSSALPYEPYGQFKIPITCGGNTYNVFTTAPLRKIGSYADYEQLSVGEGRKIAKLSFTGNETGWTLRGGTPADICFISQSDLGIIAIPNNGICNVAKLTEGNSFSTLQEGEFILGSTNFGIRIPPYTTTTEALRTFLRSMNAAGTPVTIWYVLATEQTTPTQLPTITPTDGNDTFAVNTTVPPSAVTIKGHVKARGT